MSETRKAQSNLAKTGLAGRFGEMDCFLLAGGKDNPRKDLERDGDISRLEKGYRRYAQLFERVTLVLKRDQTTVPYVNYPHICDTETEHGAVYGVKAALEQAESDAVFIGSSDIVDFPLELACELVRRYNGELFLGYRDWQGHPDSPQPLFGVFSKRLAERLEKTGGTLEALRNLVKSEGTLVPLPA